MTRDSARLSGHVFLASILVVAVFVSFFREEFEVAYGPNDFSAVYAVGMLSATVAWALWMARWERDDVP